MENYRNILLAVDFVEQAQVVIDRAKNLAAAQNATLHLIHIVETMQLPDTGYSLDGGLDVELTNELVASAKTQLLLLAKTLGINENHIWVGFGSPKLEINRIAEENQIDLIVIGSHGRHGLELLLGSTANGVFRHAKCDILAVSLKEN